MADNTPATAEAAAVLARLIQYSSAVLSAGNREEAAQLLVSRLRQVLPVDRAVLVKYGWRKQLIAVDTGADVVRQSRYSQALLKIAGLHADDQEPTAYPPEGRAGDPRDEGMRSAMEGTTGLWLPLRTDSSTKADYGLWLERWQARAWGAEEQQLLQQLVPAMLAALQREQQAIRWGRWIAIAALLCLLIPVNQSVVAPAQVVPDQPRVVFAPFDGILENVAVRPGQRVAEGDVLATYDQQLLDQQLETARREVAAANAELVRLEGAAYTDQQARAALPVQKIAIEQAESRLVWLQAQHGKTAISAPVAGVVILEAEGQLIGAPVKIGEALMKIADPALSRIDIYVPLRDAALAQVGGEVLMVLDRQPLVKHAAVVSQLGFDVSRSPDDSPAMLVKAKWLADAPDGSAPGQQGTARLLGGKTVLGWQLLRKPWQQLGAFLGW